MQRRRLANHWYRLSTSISSGVHHGRYRQTILRAELPGYQRPDNLGYGFLYIDVTEFRVWGEIALYGEKYAKICRERVQNRQDGNDIRAFFAAL